MKFGLSNLWGIFGTKQEKLGAVTAFEETREGQPKAFINNFFYKPPFGYPRYKNLNYYRKLANSVYVDMAETAIIDEVCAVSWDIVAEDKAGNELPGQEKQVEEIQDFFNNPNTNKESWEDIMRQMLPDLLEINSGVLVKVFDAYGKMVEIVARDGASFTKNPDVYGMYTNRADIILMKDIYSQETMSDSVSANYPTLFLGGSMSPEQAQEEGAYFQYGWNTAHKPVPFGKREIVWLEKKRRTDDLYGRSAMEVLSKTVQTLIYSVEHNFEYFSDNSIPPGVMGLEGMTSEEVKAFAKQWIESQKKQDENGNWKKAFHKMPIVNKTPKFEKLGFTNQELQIIEQQKWWAKLVWAAFGITSTELGFTEDAKGSANQIVQSSIAKKRIIYPLLRLIEYHINTEIMPEFGYPGIKFKFKIFDVDEETKKWNLYKLQVEDSGLKTANEIRNAEGLDPVDDGDELRKKPTQGNNFYMNPDQENNRQNRDFQNQRDKMTNKPDGTGPHGRGNGPGKGKADGSGMNKKDIETKPGMGHSDKWWEVYHALIREGHDKESAAKITNSRVKKASDTDSPLILKPGEEMDEEEKIKEVIVQFLKENKQKIFDMLEQNKPEDQLIKIKGFADIPKLIKKIFGSFALKKVVNDLVKSIFIEGWDYSEKKLERNIPFNQGALEFLQDHTFDNIKGMTDEIANDLKQELERGIINGEGISKIKERVNKVFDVGENRAEMIARTETTRAENNGRLLSAKASGEELKKKVIVTHDNRTSELCKRMEGQTVAVNEKFKDPKTGEEWECPPFHVNCRSDFILLE